MLRRHSTLVRFMPKMLESVLFFSLAHYPSLIILLLCLHLASNYFRNNLNKYPGPLLASLTNWWRFFDVLGRRSDVTHEALHRKHGDIVRLGPTVLSFANPDAARVIYGLNKGFVKVILPLLSLY